MNRIPMAESIGIGWRLESESGGGMNRNRVAACAGIRNRLQITGNSSAFMNPVIETGVIHCRALLEFLGLCVSPKNPTKLVPRSRKSRRDDWGIEDFANAAGALPLVTPQQAVSRYKGDPVEAEKALASVLHTANKGLAHLTAGLSAAATEISVLDIASHGVPALVISHLYTPLGLAAPKTSVSSTRRDDCPFHNLQAYDEGLTLDM